MQKFFTSKSFVKFSRFSNLNRIFFHIFWAKSEKTKIVIISPLELLMCQVSAKSGTKKFFTHFTSLTSLTHYDYRKSFVNFVLLILQRNFLVNWSKTSSRKFYKRIPFNFEPGSFYIGFPWTKLQGNPL